MCGSCLSRRTFLAGSAATTVALSGCDEVSLVSEEQVERMGLEAWQQVTAQNTPSRDPALRDAAATVGNRLLRAAGESASDWEIRVFASPEVNAFALPGNKIGIYEGMFSAAQTPDQLAAIVGHEIGHLKADHARSRISAQVAKDTGLRILNWALQVGDIEFADEIAGALGVGIELGLVLPYSRTQEVEADRFGVLLMGDAGYAPEAAIALWQRMAQLGGARGPDFLATHPGPEKRIEEIRELIAQGGQ